VVAAEDFFVGTYATALEPSEVLVSVDIPLAAGNAVFFFDEVARRQGDYAMAGLAACALRQGGLLNGVRLAFFAVSDMPHLATGAMALAEGKPAASLDVEAICTALGDGFTPQEDLTTSADAKLHLMKVLTRRAFGAFAAGEA